MITYLVSFRFFQVSNKYCSLLQIFLASCVRYDSQDATQAFILLYWQRSDTSGWHEGNEIEDYESSHNSCLQNVSQPRNYYLLLWHSYFLTTRIPPKNIHRYYSLENPYSFYLPLTYVFINQNSLTLAICYHSLNM